MRILFSAALFLCILSLGSHANALLINGAGSTFSAPIYTKWFQDYKKTNPSIEINYQSIGSGAGIKQLIAKTVDFGASDAPMTDEELKSAGSPVIHIPTVLGAVVVSYNLPELKEPIKLDAAAIADIFQGKITKWNDPRLISLNKGAPLPAKDIIVVYRSDSSGTTAVFTDYLAKVSSSWAKDVGQGKSVKWPVGLGGKGNEGVTAQVKNTPGAVGYVELAYSISEKMPTASVQNKAGHFIVPDLKSVSAAAAGSLKSMPADFRTSITNSEAKDAYPISSFTYVLVYQNMNGEKGSEFVKFLNWAMDNGQKSASALNYAPLPTSLVALVKNKIKTVSLK